MHKEQLSNSEWLVVLTSIIILILIGFILVTIVINKVRLRTYQYKLTEREIVFQKEMLKSQLEISKQTLEDISSDIHDNLGQKLSLARLYLNNNAEFQIEESFRQKLEDSDELLAESIDYIRNLRKSRNAETIAHNGLVQSVESILAQLKRAGKHTVELELIGTAIFYEEAKELMLYRIFQECINNIIKHAEATVVKVVLIYETEMFQMTISDNGKGYRYFKENDASGMGLKNIYKRVASCNGECYFDSDENGTIFNFKMKVL